MHLCVDGLYSQGRNKRGMLISGALEIVKITKSYFMGSLQYTRGSKKHTIICTKEHTIKIHSLFLL